MTPSKFKALSTVRSGKGYEVAESCDPFREFVDASAEISITEREIVVRFQNPVQNLLLIAASVDKTESVVPWLENG